MVGIVICMSFILLLQIVTRYVAFFPIPWSQELLQYLNIWLVFLGAGLAVREGAHIRIDMLQQALPPGMRRLFGVLSDGISLSLVCLVARQAYVLMGKTASQSFGSFPLTMAWFYLSLLLGCSIMALNYVLLIAGGIRSLSGGGRHS